MPPPLNVAVRVWRRPRHGGPQRPRRPPGCPESARIEAITLKMQAARESVAPGAMKAEPGHGGLVPAVYCERPAAGSDEKPGQ